MFECRNVITDAERAVGALWMDLCVVPDQTSRGLITDLKLGSLWVHHRVFHTYGQDSNTTKVIVHELPVYHKCCPMRQQARESFPITVVNGKLALTSLPILTIREGNEALSARGA